ncbi:unnamed protein product [Porites lobata]|uniref:Uncharacterized protein n=1 Tax=Porites lobata TaxID=104759 RepID=A0ABN8P3K3_9CNID|nr:unnamed protein product [Porites lobata]
MKYMDFHSLTVIVLLLWHIKVLQCASKFEVELDLDKGLVVIPPVQGSKSQVHLIHGPTTSSKPGMCDGQALVRLDFSGPYKKAKIELMYGREPRLWTATISDSERSYGFGSNYDFSSNCASVQLYNRQFRIYSNRLPGYMFKTIDGDSLMTVLDDVVDKGVNMTIDISDETVNWKTHSGNRTKFFYDVKPPFRNNKYLFTLSGQAPVYGPPTDSYVYAGFNRVPYGNFHNGSGLCRVKITFKRDLRKDSSCATGEHDCDKEHAICIPTKRSYKCSCKLGFHGVDGRKCKEYNPCSIAKGGCEHFCQNNGGRVSCSCQEGFTLHPNMRNCRRDEQVSIISKKVRVRLEQVLPCKRKELKDEILAKLQKKFLSQEVCNIPCKILNLQLRCKQQKGQTGKVEKVSVSFDIELNESAIATSKFCNNSCVKCQMEERLKKMIYDLRIHADNNKLNVSVDDQIFTVLRKSVRVQKETNHCSKEKSRPRRRPVSRCRRGEYFDVFLNQCMNCSRGTYQPNKSENFCFRCPGNTTTLFRGATDISQCIETKCGGNLTSLTGAITSPNHPDPYPKGIECVWHIRCPKDRRLLMLIPNISIPLTTDCSDHLVMRENASPFSKTTYYKCETYMNPVTFISRSKDLYVKFSSKSSDEMADGFKMFYVTFEEKYRELVASIVENGTLYGNSSLQRILKDENLVTQILATMAEPRSFFSNKRQSLTFKKNFPEFYDFAEKKVREILYIGPPTRR